MAQTTETAERINIKLRSDHAMVDDLVWIAAEWSDLNSYEQLSWYADWDQLVLTDLPELSWHYHDGVIDEAQAESYRALLRKLVERMPLVEQLDLTRPPVSLEP